MENQQSEALKIASQIELSTKCGFIGSAAQYQNLLLSASSQLRGLHARVHELEAMLESVGAGGVSSQRMTQAADHIEQDRKMVAQEPFGYFKAEPFGWRDCAEIDEGAIALYEAPQPQADARAAERLDALYKALEVCAAELFAKCAHQGRAMKYVEQARKALAAEQCARAAIAAEKEI